MICKVSGKTVSKADTLCPQTNIFVDRAKAKPMVISSIFFGTLFT